MRKETYGTAKKFVNGEWVDMTEEEANHVNDVCSRLGRGMVSDSVDCHFTKEKKEDD